MDRDTKARIAFAVGRVLCATTKGGLFDHAERRFLVLSGTASKNAIRIYDHQTASHVTGVGNGVDFRLYDHGRGAHLSFRVKGALFSGQDHGSGHQFSGTTNGTAIQLYDHSDNTWSLYTG